MTSAATAERFHRVRCLGEGGMGVVYEAIDLERGRPVALKTLRHMTAETLAQLKREFRAMQDLHHPNLVSLGELVSEGDQWFFTMELVSGVEFLDHVRWRPALKEAGPDSHLSERSLPAGPTLALERAVPSAPLFDDVRLRSALRQLAGALCAMHAAGLVHRDIKSSNVRITPDGRAVLLDFGLVIGTAGETVWSQQIAGTPAYMAPEQASSAAVGPEADWYGLGVLLYEALTRRLPFDGPIIEVLARKQKERPPAPATLAPGVPDDLNELCLALLSIEPSARPKGDDVLCTLGLSSEASASGTHTQNVFVGRAAELDELMAAFRDSRRRGPVAVIVEGESGVGKSALVRRFAQRLASEVPEAVVLAGRCYERESVLYKAFDGVVDALSRLLTRLGEEAERVVPTKPGPLAKVFPVLRRVKAIAAGSPAKKPEIDGRELRTRAFASLRELFTRLADRRPLVIMIEDAQWSDADSFALLADLLRPPEAPAMMLLLTARTDVSPHSTTDQRSRSLTEILKGDLRRIELGPLSEQDAMALASELLERSGVVDASRARWTADQAGGHPLFIDMILRRSDRLPGSGGASLRLEDVLWALIEELDAAPRAILEILAVAAGPISQKVARQAGSVSTETFPKALAVLRISHLVQTTRAGAEDYVEPYHDRVRATMLTHLDVARQREFHRRIAVALETSASPDPEALVLHWRGAGDAQQAAHYAALAGDRAAEALAFDQAAGFYELALAKGDASPADRRALLIKQAKVHESAGHGERAAQVYLKAAEGAPPLQRAELERAASVELLSSGRLAEGATVLHRVLAAVGFKAPHTPLRALFWLLIYRVWLAARGLRFKERSPDEVRREDRARIDTLFAAAMGFALYDMLLSVCLNLRHLIAALRAGDRFQVLRATCLHVAALATAGRTPSKLERALSAIAARVTEQEDSVDGRAYFEACHGAALYLRGHWKEALRTLDASLSKQQTHSHRAGWQSNSHVFGCWALRYMGQHAELTRRHARLLVDADRRGDLYTSVQLRDGSLAAVWLADDNPEEARRHAREAMAQWPRTRYLIQHWHMMFGEAEIELYVGDGAGAYARIEKDRVALNKSLIGKVQHMRAVTAFVRGRCAIAVARAEPALQKTRLSEARLLARQIDQEKMAWTAPLAAILRAGVASVQGDREGAAGSLRIAIESAEVADMHGFAHAARYQLGLLSGGSAGESLVREANDVMSGEGIRAPARFAHMLVPGNWKAGDT